MMTAFFYLSYTEMVESTDLAVSGQVYLAHDAARQFGNMIVGYRLTDHEPPPSGNVPDAVG